MTHPGPPQQYPQEGQPHGQYPQQVPQGQQHPQQYVQHAYPQWGQMPPQQGKRKSKGPLIAVLAVVGVVLLAGAAVGGLFLMEELAKEEKPVVNTSLDLPKAPLGCALFEENEVAPYIPGRTDYEPSSFGSQTKTKESAQCSWSNRDTFRDDKVPNTSVWATSYIWHATSQQSGVDQAKEEMEREGRASRKAGDVHVPGADEAMLREVTDNKVEVISRYRNVIYKISYDTRADGANLKRPATELTALVISKITSGS
ncbi:hypothetical protein LZ318_06760 [Saccharopolyspora indica]|uniref:hypothetical protein n=1 Tax=Saccharopolyspora indica TaxID=1229659 RepID=UPI0022EA1F53|nr:hypothetical protein [Saccharopolyspora indica]MDA3648718.1 hypothetical protein [Saccharopolyspora indica]